jgi:ubiquinone/menaquinone biosynthesis C-methylase UbiE
MNLDPELYYTEFADACAKIITDKDCKKYFKRYDTKELPRIIKVIGILKNLMPETMLDVGSGRGRSLWPMAYNLPDTEIVCADKSTWRCEVIDAVHRGGVDRISVINSDMCPCGLPTNSVDVVTALEVIEHALIPGFMFSELLRIAKKFVIISVPSKPDNNPDHLHFFTPQKIDDLVDYAEIQTGKIVRRLTIDYVPKHMIILIRIG